MTQQTSPFVEAKYGWALGEDGWNTGMDENLLKFSYLHDSNIDSIVTTLPTPVDGEAHFRTTDKRVHFVVDGSYLSTPLPTWHELTLKATGVRYVFDGTDLTVVPDPLDSLADSTGAALVGIVGDPSKTVQDFIDDLATGTEVTTTEYDVGTKLVGFQGRTLFEKLRDKVSVKDFGAVGDNVSDDLAAFNAAVTHVKSLGGGVIYVPTGTYKLSGTLSLTPIAGKGFHDIILEGAGCDSSYLNFATATAGTDGIGVFGWGGRLGISRLSVINAPAIGININKGVSRGSTSWISRLFIHDVNVDGCGSDGIRMLQTYMGEFSNIESRNNGGYGINLQGFHTSMVFTRCWTGGDAVFPDGGNVGGGWYVNGLTYSQFIGCSSDQNSGPGYIVQNIAGCVFSGCGSESNGQEGWLVRTRTTDTDGIPASTTDINGLVFDGCFGLNNSTSSSSLYANLIGVTTANSRPIQSLTIRNCVDIDSPPTRASLVFNASSGYIDAKLSANVLSSSTTKGGDVVLQDSSKVGLSTVIRLSSSQSIPNATETALPLPIIASNSLRATVGSGGITIPKGVNRIKVTAGVSWDGSTTGSRNIRVYKTSLATVALNGSAQASVNATGFDFAFQNISSGIFEVTEGDFFGLAVWQTSGAALNARSSPYTFLSVEVMG